MTSIRTIRLLLLALMLSACHNNGCEENERHNGCVVFCEPSQVCRYETRTPSRKVAVCECCEEARP